MSVFKKTYVLKLYVAGNTPNSVRALKTLKNILEEEFQGVYALKVIDVLKNPQLAEEDKILATPTLAKVLPPPVRKIKGKILILLILKAILILFTLVDAMLGQDSF